MKLVAIVASLAFLEGCSFIVRPDHNRTAPIVDTLVAAGAGLWCLSAVGQGDGGRGIYPPMIICVPLVPIALIEGISAGYGFHRVSAHSPGGRAPTAPVAPRAVGLRDAPGPARAE